MKNYLFLLVAGSLAFGACDDSAKKAEEAKMAADKAAADKAAAEKKAADEAAAAKAAAAKALTEKRAAAKKTLQTSTDAIDRKSTFLKEKAAKLTGAAKTKAEKAMDTLDKARADVTADIKSIESSSEDQLADAQKRGSEHLATVQKSLDEYEAAVTGKPAATK